MGQPHSWEPAARRRSAEAHPAQTGYFAEPNAADKFAPQAQAARAALAAAVAVSFSCVAVPAPCPRAISDSFAVVCLVPQSLMDLLSAGPWKKREKAGWCPRACQASSLDADAVFGLVRIWLGPALGPRARVGARRCQKRFSLGSRTPRRELARRAAELERASAGSAAREQFIGPKFQSSRRAFSSGGSGARLAGRGGGGRCAFLNISPSTTSWRNTALREGANA